MDVGHGRKRKQLVIYLAVLSGGSGLMNSPFECRLSDSERASVENQTAGSLTSRDARWLQLCKVMYLVVKVKLAQKLAGQ